MRCDKSIANLRVFCSLFLTKKLSKYAENLYNKLMNIGDKLADYKKKHIETKQHLHSPAHLLADELSKKFSDPKHFGAYLKLALTHEPAILRKIAGDVLENPHVKTPAKLFMFLVKKNSQAK